ncbi:MAG TPA: membrane dipeptidase [Bryobacteraceae bacterium]|nr:membrane dipeptidase [Bryobacteraceae bacterium]
MRPYSSRAIDLVGPSNVIDMLSLPTLNWSLLDQWCQAPEAFGPADFAKLQRSGINVFHPAVAFTKEADTYEITKAWFEKWNRFVGWHSNYFLRVRTAADPETAQSEGKIGIVLGMQDANHLRSVSDLDEFYAMGQRLTQLTYNSVNRLGSGCKVAHDGGLSAYGAEIVARMNAIGMAIDVSHCGERTSLDAIAASAKPVLITHSNCRAIAPGVARCKSDEVLRAAARKGGVLGVTSVRQFVGGPPVSIEHVLDHFDHAVRAVGIDHVGLGSDFDLDAHPTYDTPGLNNPERVYALAEGLIRRKYTDEQIRLILGGNFQRALNQIWGEPATAPRS